MTSYPPPPCDLASCRLTSPCAIRFPTLYVFQRRCETNISFHIGCASSFWGSAWWRCANLHAHRGFPHTSFSTGAIRTRDVVTNKIILPHLPLFFGSSILICGSAVIPSIISLTLPAHGSRAKIWPIRIYELPLFWLLSCKCIKSSSQILDVINGLSMHQLLPRQIRKSRARAQILLLTPCSLHLATTSHLWHYFPAPCFTVRKQ